MRRAEGSFIRAHLPNPGRMRELLLPGSAVVLEKHPPGSGRRTRYTAVAVEKKRTPVLLHTSRTNTVACRLLQMGLVPGLEGYRVEKREVTVGGSGRLLLEVKSCTLFGRSIAMFPDAVTERGRRHIVELASLSGKEMKTGVLFVIHWPRVRYFLPEYHTDPLFARALQEARRKLLVKAVAVGWRKDITLSRRVRDVPIPWRVLEREGMDGGSYVVVLNLRRKRRIRVRSLGEVLFERGYYLYVGSAARRLTARIDRHRRMRKRFHWHIDWLRDQAEFHGAFPVRTRDRLECRMAVALGKIAGWSVPGFGSSDCPCGTHLFAMDSDPLKNTDFIRFLMYFRIDRLEEDRPCADLLDADETGR